TDRIGHVTIPCDGFRAKVYGDLGILNVTGDKSKPIALPAGDWKLMSYTIDLTGYQEKASEEEGEDSEETSILSALADALAGEGGSPSAPRTTRISADGGDDQVLKVTKGETVSLPFGPPFKPVVTSSSSSVEGGQEVRLSLAVVGSGGERCTSLSVDGGSPDRPTFTIRTADGKEVEQGSFKWG
ncbi:MAG: hypothetical protein ACYTG0_06330, partial [Planctomycetota bacterium]